MRWKRLAAIVLLAVLVACEPNGEEAAPSTAPEPPRPLELRVVGDFAVDPARPDTEVTNVGAKRLRAGNGSTAFFAVQRPPVPARCIAELRLRLFLHEWPGVGEEELALYPSHVFDAHRKRDGDRFGYSGALLDVRPRAPFEGVVSGWGEWDVTGIAKRWIGGWTFPSQGRRAPERGPIVLALRDTDLVSPSVTATVASTESGHAPEALALVREGCPARGRA